jgi:hypothetical protein
MALAIWREIIGLLNVLFGDVSRDHFVRHIPGAAAKIPFQPPHQSANRHLRWY